MLLLLGKNFQHTSVSNSTVSCCWCCCFFLWNDPNFKHLTQTITLKWKNDKNDEELTVSWKKNKKVKGVHVLKLCRLREKHLLQNGCHWAEEFALGYMDKSNIIWKKVSVSKQRRPRFAHLDTINLSKSFFVIIFFI